MKQHGYGNGQIHLWNVTAPRRDPQRSRTVRIYATAYSPDGTMLAATDRRNIYPWNTMRRTLTAVI